MSYIESDEDAMAGTVKSFRNKFNPANTDNRNSCNSSGGTINEAVSDYGGAQLMNTAYPQKTSEKHEGTIFEVNEDDTSEKPVILANPAQ